MLVTINSEGFRGPELRARPPLRVVVYGDSSMEGSSPACRDPAQRLKDPPHHARARAGRGRRRLGRRLRTGPGLAATSRTQQPGSVSAGSSSRDLFPDDDFGDLLRNQLYRHLRRHQPPGGREPSPEHLPPPGVRGRGAANLLSLLRGVQHLLHRRSQPRPRYSQRLPRSSRLSAQVPRASPVPSTLLAVMQDFRMVASVYIDHYDADLSLTPGSPAAPVQRPCSGMLGGQRPPPRRLCPRPWSRHPFPESTPATATTWRFDRATFGLRRLAPEQEAAEAARRAGLPVVDLFPPLRRRRRPLVFITRNDHWNTAAAPALDWSASGP